MPQRDINELLPTHHPSGRRGWMIIGFVVVAVSLLLAGFAAYQGQQSLVRSHTRLLGRTAIDMTREYVDKHNGKWPRSWEELETIENPLTNGSPINVFRQRLHFDFDADPAKLARQQASEFTAIRPIMAMSPEYRDYWQVESLLETLRKHHPPAK